MATTVSMPQLGETVTEGTILRWAKQIGDTIAEDEVLLEISTDKVDTEVPSPVAGTILEILVTEGDTVEVGVELVVIGDADSDAAPAEPVPATDLHPGSETPTGPDTGFEVSADSGFEANLVSDEPEDAPPMPPMGGGGMPGMM